MTADETLQTTSGNAPSISLPTKSEVVVAEHDTLKYHLLGPSLTKAGQDAVDQQKVILSEVHWVVPLLTLILRYPRLSTMPPKAPNSSTMKSTRTRTLPTR